MLPNDHGKLAIIYTGGHSRAERKPPPLTMSMYRPQPRDVRKIYIADAQIAHDRIISRYWQNKYGRLLDSNTEKIGSVSVTKPGWWKDADYDISESASIPRDIKEIMPGIKYPPRVRRFPPHTEPGPEITDHIPPVSLQYKVPEEQMTSLSEYNGRFQYLKNRWGLPMNKRFVLPPNVNGEYGWDGLFPKPATVNPEDIEVPKNFGIRPVLATEFYRQTGVINHKKSATSLDLSAR